MRAAITCMSVFSATLLSTTFLNTALLCSQDKSIILPTQDGKQPEAIFIEAVDLSLTKEFSTDATFAFRSGRNRFVLHGYPSLNQNLLDYLASSQVQQQIELSGDQKKQLSELRKNLAEGMKKISSRFPGRDNPEMPAAMRTKLKENYSVEIKALRKKFEDEVKESLVPQQLNLIKQLRFNSSVRMFGFSHTLTQKPFVEDTKVTSKQSQEIKKIKQETEAAIQKKIAEMRAAAKEKMLKVLDSGQRKAIKELEGKSKSKPLQKL